MHVSRDIAACLQQSPFLSVMVDEMADVSNREQMTVVRSITECFEVHNAFLHVSSAINQCSHFD